MCKDAEITYFWHEDKIYLLKVAGFIANRIAFNQQRSFSRFIIRLSIVATAISVAAMIVALAFVNGFQQEVSGKIFSFWGHLRIQEKQPYKAIFTEEIPIEKNDTAFYAIKKHPLVKSIHPFATKYAILKTKDEMDGVLLKGIDPHYDFKEFGRFITQGKALRFNDSTYSREIMISENTASQLQLKLNDRIFIYFMKANGKLRPDRVTITGIFKTGIEDYDKTFAIGDLKLIQRLNDWDSLQVGGYEVFLQDRKDINKAVMDIYNIDEFPVTWDTQSIENISPEIFDWLKMQDTTRNILIIFMTIVAVINLISCLIILVLERLQMIGILKALGTTDWTIQQIFFRHALIITCTGIGAGIFFGLGLCWLQQTTGFITLDESAYYVSKAAVKIVWWQVGVVILFTFIVSFLVLLIPTFIVKKIQPVNAIRFN